MKFHPEVIQTEIVIERDKEIGEGGTESAVNK